MASNIDPLSDPLSALSFNSPLSEQSTPFIVPTSNVNRVTSWTKHDLNEIPFSNNSGEVWNSTRNEDIVDSVVPVLDQDNINEPSNSHTRRLLNDSDEEFNYPSSSPPNTTTSSTTAKAISIKPGSLTRRRSPSTSVLRGSPSEFSTSITPRNHATFPNFKNDENDTAIDLSTTPSANNSSAVRFSAQKSIYNLTTGEIDLIVLNELITKACQIGELFRLRALLEGDGNKDYPSIFDLANTPSLHTAQTPLHTAAKNNRLDIVKYLIGEAGALVDLEDAEGETPLHRATNYGHLEVCKTLIEAGANVNLQDLGGWTPLHIASSRGYLDLVQYFVEKAGAQIDLQSKHGYTALMNAAAQAHLVVVQFFIIKHGANPFLRNAYQETAFDLAASVFEILISTILANYERSFYSSNSTTILQTVYNPLLFHSTYPVLLHENQRLSRPSLKRISSLGSLAIGNNPRWSAKALSPNDKRAAFTMPQQIGSRLEDNNNEFIENLPVFRSEIGLPLIGNESEFILPFNSKKGKEVSRSSNTTGRKSGLNSIEGVSNKSKSNNRKVSATSSLSAVLGSTSANSSPLVGGITPSNSNPSTSTSSSHSNQTEGEPAWFWLSDFIIDLTDSNSSPIDGWSYSNSFDSPNEEWTSEPNDELNLILNGNGKGLIGMGGTKFVRRRRWIRIMRRRFDIPHWGFGGILPNVASDDELVERKLEKGEEEEINLEADYLARAMFLVEGEHYTSKLNKSSSSSSSIKSSKSNNKLKSIEGEGEVGQLNKNESRKLLARLERASQELNIGILIDLDEIRKKKALDQLELYSIRIETLKESLGLNGSINENEDSDDEFIYNGADTEQTDEEEEEVEEEEEEDINRNNIRRPSSTRSKNSYLSQTSPSYSNQPLPDLVPSLSRAPEFRVPTHETSILLPPPPPPSSSSLQFSPSSIGSNTSKWINDSSRKNCKDCSKLFTFLKRKHHCRKCGEIFCNDCSSNFNKLTSLQLIKEPTSGNSTFELNSFNSFYRTCDSCHLNLSLPIGSEVASAVSVAAFFPSSPIIDNTSTSNNNLPDGSESGRSDISELGNCPVCGNSLLELGSKEQQEEHVQICLETGAGAIARNGSYLVFNLPPDSRLVRERTECGICYVEFEEKDKVAILPCFCHYHLPCIRSWMERGKGCPYHSR